MGYEFDVLIIGGGGSAGFTAATTALKSGAKVGMVEGGRLGGLCILAGCMPSKTLLHSAAELKGNPSAARSAYPEVARRTRALVEMLAGHRVEAVEAKKAQGLEVIEGWGKLVGEHEVEVGGRKLSARAIVVATGSRELIPPIEGLAEAGYLTSGPFMRLESLPESLVVLGGGTMAVELGQYAARMGVETTIIQRSPRLLSKEPEKVGPIIARALAADGARVLTGTRLRRVVRTSRGVRVEFEKDGTTQEVQAEALLVALGRVPNTQGLGLKELGVELGPRGGVVVDRFMRSSLPHIFAAGDVTDTVMVVNLAIEQGRVAGYNATHEQMQPIRDDVLPRAVFTDPQYARVGMSAEEARAAGIKFVEVSFNLQDLPAARTYPRLPEGYMAMRAEEGSGRIIGAELVAPEAALMIHDVAVAMRGAMTAAELASIPYVHPCLGEIVMLTAHRLARRAGR